MNSINQDTQNLPYWTPQSDAIDLEDIDINSIQYSHNYLYYKGIPLNMKIKTSIQVDVNELRFYIQGPQTLIEIQKKLGAHESKYTDLLFSPSTTVTDVQGHCYMELGLDSDGHPATYLLPYLEAPIECVLTVYLSTQLSHLCINVMDIQYID